MRILVLNQPFHPDVVATAQITKDLADELVRRGHSVTVIASRSLYGRLGASLPRRERVDGIDIMRVGGNLFGKETVLGRLADFGAWVGGLTGIDSENRKLRRFHDDIEAGKYLLLIYSPKGHGEEVKTMMNNKHPEAGHVATDRHFINPFSRVRRKKRARQADQAYE